MTCDTESHTGKEISSTRHLEWVMVMVFNATFTNISIILLLSVLLVEESAVNVPEENTDLPQVTDKLKSYNVVSSTPRNQRDSNSQC